MNKAQKEYAKPVISKIESLVLTATGGFGYVAGMQGLSLAYSRNDLVFYYASFMSAALGALMLGIMGGTVAVNAHLWYNRQRLSRDPERYPLENVDAVSVVDTAGLDALLDCTYKQEKLEWGTFLRSSSSQRTGFIEEILSPSEANKLIVARTSASIYPRFGSASRFGYNGFHHYHPRGGGISYNVSANDRHRTLGWLNILSFNMTTAEGKEPEVIAYNSRDVFIASNGRKTELFKASASEISAYLGRFS